VRARTRRYTLLSSVVFCGRGIFAVQVTCNRMHMPIQDRSHNMVFRAGEHLTLFDPLETTCSRNTGNAAKTAEYAFDCRAGGSMNGVRVRAGGAPQPLNEVASMCAEFLPAFVTDQVCRCHQAPEHLPRPLTLLAPVPSPQSWGNHPP